MQDEDTTSHRTEQATPRLIANSPTSRLRFSLRTLMIAIIVMCGLLAVFVPSVRHLRRQLQQDQCQFQLRRIGLALLIYRDVYKSFPCAITCADDGTPMHSWRCLIWPFFEIPEFFPYDRNEPWSGPSNSQINQETRWSLFYRCPSAPASQNQMCTNYVMIIDDRPGKPNGPPHLPGSVPPSLDPKSAVIVIEIADSDIHWMEPRDVLLSELSKKINDRSKRSLSSSLEVTENPYDC